MDTAISFSRWLRQRRRALDLTQAELAARVGCATDTLRKIESGALRPSRQIVERLADLLAIPSGERESFIQLARGGPLAAHTNSHAGREPYIGLHTFRDHDADFFFGREAAVAALIEQVRDARFLAVLGPSGSGKSSVVLAGLLPALRRGALPGSAHWCYRTLRPGARPLDALTAALADDGRPTTDDGRWTTDDGRWTTDDGRWTMDDGRWTMDDRRPICNLQSAIAAGAGGRPVRGALDPGAGRARGARCPPRSAAASVYRAIAGGRRAGWPGPGHHHAARRLPAPRRRAQRPGPGHRRARSDRRPNDAR